MAALSRDVLTLIAPPDRIENYYETLGELGAGGYGVVKRCRRVKRPVIHDLALKIIEKGPGFKSCVLRPNKEDYQERLLKFDHPNVTCYVDFLEDEKYAYMVMPPCNGPALWDHLEEMKFVSEFVAQGIMLQVVSALAYIHGLGVAHRDVNPGNFMYFTPAREVLKLVDFGLCSVNRDMNDAEHDGSCIGTLPFMAPEVFTGEYTTKLDVWSAGVMLYVILTGQFPFNGATPEELLAAVEKGVDLELSPWPAISNRGKVLVEQMLSVEASRPSAAALKQHEWFDSPRSQQGLMPGKATGRAKRVADEALMFTTIHTGSHGSEQDAKPAVVRGRRTKKVVNFDVPVASARKLVRAQSAGLPTAKSSGLAEPLLDPADKLKVLPHTVAHKPMLKRKLLASKNINEARLTATFLPLGTSVSVEGEDSPQGAQFKNYLTEWDATVSTFSTIVGAAILATPYAFTLAGAVAVPLIIFFTLLECFTAHLLTWTFIEMAPEADALGIKPALRNFGFLADCAFGAAAKSAMTTFFVLELWGYLLSYTVVCAVHLHQVLPALNMPSAVLGSAVLTYILTFAPPALLTKVNVASNSVFILCCALFVVSGVLLPDGYAPDSDFVLVDPGNILSACGILVFNAASHACYPSIMQSMADPGQYSGCVRQAYAAALAFYLVIAVPGYFCFGAAIKPSLVENIGLDRGYRPIPSLSFIPMNTLAAFGMVVKMAAMQPLVFKPLSATLAGLVGERVPALGGDRTEQFLFRPAILLLSGVVALLFADQMAKLINLIGSIFCMNIAFVMPVAFFWKLSKTKLGLLQRAGFVLVMLMGVMFAVLGAIDTFES